MDIKRRTLLKLAALAAAERVRGVARQKVPSPGRKVVILTIGGIRRKESFSLDGTVNIPHLFKDMLPQALFYPYVMNEGVTSHVNTISSILTGTWQQIDDWGSRTPKESTLMEYYRNQRRADPADTWVVSSNKAVTKNIAPGANVVLAKQMMIEAVERIILGQTSRNLLTRDNLHQEMNSIFLKEYQRIGWELPSDNPKITRVVLDAYNAYFDGPEGATGGDEMTYMTAREIMRQISPAIMVINFSGMEIAHSGIYSVHLAGIQSADRLSHKIWQFLQSEPAYQRNTTFVIMPEFGRDPDGSTTNGFFNHRTDTNTCRLCWMMVLGNAVKEPRVEERLIRQVDLAPTLGAYLGVDCKQSIGRRLEKFAV